VKLLVSLCSDDQTPKPIYADTTDTLLDDLAGSLAVESIWSHLIHAYLKPLNPVQREVTPVNLVFQNTGRWNKWTLTRYHNSHLCQSHIRTTVSCVTRWKSARRGSPCTIRLKQIPVLRQRSRALTSLHADVTDDPERCQAVVTSSTSAYNSLEPLDLSHAQPINLPRLIGSIMVTETAKDVVTYATTCARVTPSVGPLPCRDLLPSVLSQPCPRAT
jgi:hypothetical protein